LKALGILFKIEVVIFTGHPSIQIEQIMNIRDIEPHPLMRMLGTFGSGVMTVTLLGFAVSLTLPCQAEPAGDADLAAL